MLGSSDVCACLAVKDMDAATKSARSKMADQKWDFTVLFANPEYR